MPQHGRGDQSGTLYIVSAFHQRLDGDEVRAALASYFGSRNPAELASSMVLFPAGVAVDGRPFGRAVAYDREIGLEKSQNVWRSLAGTPFATIIILGISPLEDYEEIVLACFLEANTKLFLEGGGASHDIARWQAQIRPDFREREVQLVRLSEEMQREYVRQVHRWLATELIQADFNPPTPIHHPASGLERYQAPTLAVDLAQHTMELQHQKHGASFSLLMDIDGSIVHSTDYYRAMANFVMAIDGVESVLDVGCGSGFLACYLAASGRFRTVTGVDPSRYRIAGARLHAQLTGSTATFDAMSAFQLGFADKSVDVVVTSFALEQTGDRLAEAFFELRRVARKAIILFEPTTQFFSTLPGTWHTPRQGWPTDYHGLLIRSGLSFAVRPNLIAHYFQRGAVFVIDLEGREHPALRWPHLFQPGVSGWPGGARYVTGPWTEAAAPRRSSVSIKE